MAYSRQLALCFVIMEASPPTERQGPRHERERGSPEDREREREDEQQVTEAEWQHRMQQRKAAIDKGKNTIGYTNYTRAVPRCVWMCVER